MNTIAALLHLIAKSLPAACLLVLVPALTVQAAVVAEGTYTISAPVSRAVPFRMILTPTGARITLAGGEALIFSFEKKSALIVDDDSRTYFLLPLEIVPGLLAAGLGYDPRGLGASASGRTRNMFGTSCGEVIVSGKEPRFTLHSCRATDPAWSREYTILETALGLPWTVADPPLVFVGLPLAGSLDIEGARPYRASWKITKLSRDPRSRESFTVPPGYRMDLEKLLSLQSGQR